jgi:hypothetical protein
VRKAWRFLTLQDAGVLHRLILCSQRMPTHPTWRPWSFPNSVVMGSKEEQHFKRPVDWRLQGQEHENF